MSRNNDSDYLDFSNMGGFDMGFNFDGFEENVWKFIELPVQYLDSAHDKAVEFIEDVQAILFAPFTDDEVLNEEDQSSSDVITESSPTSTETELVGPNAEASTPASSLVTVENSGCVDTDAHGTESFSSSKSAGLSLMNHVYPEHTSSDGGHIEANDLRLLPEAEGISPSEICDSSEEIILWNPDTSVKLRPRGLTTKPQDDHVPDALETDQVAEQAEHCSGNSDSYVCSKEIPVENFRENYEEEVVLHSANDPVGVTAHDSTTITQDDHVPQILHKDQPAELHCSVHSDILVDSAVFSQALLQEDSSANYEEKMVSYSANGRLEATQDNNVPQALNMEEQAGLQCSGYSGLTAKPQDDHVPPALETDQMAEQAEHCSGNSDSSVCSTEIPVENFRANYEEEVVLHSANDPVRVTVHDSTTITQDDYVPHILQKDQQAELHCSVHSDILVDSFVFFQALLQEDSSANCEEKMVACSANGLVEATQDNYVLQALNKEEQAGLHCSGHSGILVDSATFFEGLLLEDSTTNSEEQILSYSANAPVEATTHGSSAATSISHESSSDVPNSADDPNMPTDTMVKPVDIEDLRDGQEHMKNDVIEVATVPQRNNASFQKMFMRNLSSKLRWSKKQVSEHHQAMTAGSQDSKNLGYRLVSSSDDLEHDWEVV